MEDSNVGTHIVTFVVCYTTLKNLINKKATYEELRTRWEVELNDEDRIEYLVRLYSSTFLQAGKEEVMIGYKLIHSKEKISELITIGPVTQ